MELHLTADQLLEFPSICDAIAADWEDPDLAQALKEFVDVELASEGASILGGEALWALFRRAAERIMNS